MIQKNRVIALIDLSESSEPVMKFTSEFSRAIGGKVILLHKVQPMAPALSNVESKMEIVAYEKRNAGQKLRTLARGLFPEGVDFIVSDRSISSLLENLKKEDYFNWVLAGLKGTGFIKKIFLGSTILEVVDETEMLTLAFPVQKEFFLPQSLVVATHHKFPVHRKQLTGVLEGLKDRIKKLYFITFITNDEEEAASKEYLDGLRKYYEKENPDCSTFRGKDAFVEIKEYMKNQKDAFLVVQQGSRTLTDNFFRRFMVNELIFNGATPLLILSR